MQLYLCGFTEQQLEKLICIVNRGGGLSLSVLSHVGSHVVSHVVMGERETKVLDKVKQLDTG